MSIMEISAAQCLREMVSLTHSFVAIISDSAEIRGCVVVGGISRIVGLRIG